MNHPQFSTLLMTDVWISILQGTVALAVMIHCFRKTRHPIMLVMAITNVFALIAGALLVATWSSMNSPDSIRDLFKLNECLGILTNLVAIPIVIWFMFVVLKTFRRLKQLEALEKSPAG